MSKAQMIYNYMLAQKVAPYRQSNLDRISAGAETAQSSYNPMADWGNYANNAIINPVKFQLEEQLKDLKHSNEFFSSGRFAREAGAEQAANTSIMEQLTAKTNEENSAAMSAQEAALERRGKYQDLMTNLIAGPVSKPTQDTVSWTDNGLFGAIGGIGGMLRSAKGK